MTFLGGYESWIMNFQPCRPFLSYLFLILSHRQHVSMSMDFSCFSLGQTTKSMEETDFPSHLRLELHFWNFQRPWYLWRQAKVTLWFIIFRKRSQEIRNDPPKKFRHLEVGVHGRWTSQKRKEKDFQDLQENWRVSVAVWVSTTRRILLLTPPAFF